KYLEFLTKLEKFENVPWLHKKSLPFYTSTGCLYKCKFCTENLFNGYSMYNLKIIENYFTYLNKIGIKDITILDNLANPTKTRLENLIKLLIKYNIHADFPNGIRADNLNSRLIGLLSYVTTFLKISVETGDETQRKRLGKNISDQRIFEICNAAKKNGLFLQAHYLIDLPEENKENADKTLNLAFMLYKKYGCEPLIQPLIPLKGSRITVSNYPENHNELINCMKNKSKSFSKYLS
ncbi:MAG: B12-binding domain-containing radical SAM protein, partial [Candidatus Woesearchaeota archaeon]